MTNEKHELDEAVEDILQHFGIKGMKWGVRRSDEQIANAEGGGGGGGGEEEEEEDESLLEEMSDQLGEVFDALGKKLDGIGKDVKSKGMSMLTSLFGKGGDGIFRKAKPDNSKAARDLKRKMQRYEKATPEFKKKMRESAKSGKSEFVVTKTDASGYRTETTKTTKKGPLGIKIQNTKKVSGWSDIRPKSNKSNSYQPARKGDKTESGGKVNANLTNAVREGIKNQEGAKAYAQSKTKPKTDFQKKHDAGKAQFTKDSIAKEKKRKEQDKKRRKPFMTSR